ncbi:MAG: ATP-binding protein [Bacteroidales bacterium]|nr:ATP-binding protein [Bacteroidales bacterium]
MKTIDLHIIDIVHNSIRAGATQIEIELQILRKQNKVIVQIKDNGCGMSKSTLDAIRNNFFSSRKERKTGMGIALLEFHAKQAGGSFSIESEPGQGSVVKAEFQENNIDRQPLGDVPLCIATFICQYSHISFTFKYVSDTDQFGLCTDEVLQVFEGVEINNPSIIRGIAEMIDSGLK